MRHRKAGRRLGRLSGQRKALIESLALSLFDREGIRTTLPRAKELRSYAEKILTHAKKDSLAARRHVARVIRDKDVLRKLFATLGPRYADRPGGYTRIYKLGFRQGDSAEMALIELVDRPTRSGAQAPASKAAAASKAPAGSKSEASAKRRLIEREESSHPAKKG